MKEHEKWIAGHEKLMQQMMDRMLDEHPLMMETKSRPARVMRSYGYRVHDMTRATLAWFFAVLMCVLGSFARAQDTFVAVPPLAEPVTDLTATLTAQEQAALNDRLHAFEERKGSQVAVLIVPSTKPETIEQYAIRVVDRWKLGRGKVDDGAILVVAKDDRAVRIEVGYGLEGVLTDARARRIIDEAIVPRFSRGDFNGGIAAGVDSITATIDGEPLPAADRARPVDDGAGWTQMLPVVLIGVVVVGGVLRALLGRVAGAAVTGGLMGIAAWLVAGTVAIGAFVGVIAFVLTLVGGARMAGLYMAHGAGRSGGWGGRGGRFGGGGASGRW